jgi:hypothetical protein
MVTEHIQLLVAVAHGAKFMEISRTFVGLLFKLSARETSKKPDRRLPWYISARFGT